MVTVAMILAALTCGYGAGFEGYSNGKMYLGFYTPNAEYGWVVTETEVYLDTVYTKQ